MLTTRGQDLNAAATRRAPVCRRRSEVAALTLGAACAFAPALALGGPVPPVWPIPVIATAVWTVMFIAIALWRFGREEF